MDPQLFKMHVLPAKEKKTKQKLVKQQINPIIIIQDSPNKTYIDKAVNQFISRSSSSQPCMCPSTRFNFIATLLSLVCLDGQHWIGDASPTIIWHLELSQLLKEPP